jgi:hypothetical protein
MSDDKRKWLMTKEELRAAAKTIRFLDVPPFEFFTVPETKPITHGPEDNGCPFCEMEKKRGQRSE